MSMSQKAGSAALVVGVPLTSFAMLFAGSAVLLLIGRYGLGGGVTYTQALAVSAYASLVQVLGWLVRAPLMVARETAMVHLGPGVFLSEQGLATFGGRLLAGLDLFMVWQLGIAAVGLAVLARASALRAFALVVAAWLVWLVAMAALAGLHLGPGAGG
ncbi:MAG: YIP1 family protein [Candidatus Latescibacterota bacterium]